MSSLRNCRSMLTRITGNIAKLSGYPFHRLFPRQRFSITSEPGIDPRKQSQHSAIPFLIWQTNFTNQVTLPLYANHRHNRRLSPEFAYRYVSTEERLQYFEAHADPELLAAYQKLTDGAAQADLWRCFVLYREGGIYMDIDATLTRKLAPTLSGHKELFITNYGEFTNFFLATYPKNPLFAEFLRAIVENIQNYDHVRHDSVFATTGPKALSRVLSAHPEIQYVAHQQICIQGAFSNEFFQYFDRPRSKWTYHKDFICGSNETAHSYPAKMHSYPIS